MAIENINGIEGAIPPEMEASLHGDISTKTYA